MTDPDLIEKVHGALDYIADQEGKVWRGSGQADAVQRATAEIAPRVAAAIEAAGKADFREDPDDPWGYRSCGLRALRGEP